MKWLEIDQDNMCVKFSALNRDFSSPSLNPPRFNEAGAGTDMLLIITSAGDRLF